MLPIVPVPLEYASILLVDDRRENLLLLETMLRSAGYRNIVTTTDPLQGIALYCDESPDLVVLDLAMPVMDGFEVMAKLRDNAPADFLPVLVITSSDDPAWRNRALDGGATDFLTRPFDRAEALARIRNLLQVRTAYSALIEHNRALDEKAARIEGLNGELDAFSYAVAHDLRSPLRRIGGFAAMLAEKLESTLDETDRSYLDAIQRQTGQMGSMIKDLLDMAKILRKEPLRKRVDLGRIAEEIVAQLRADEPGRRVEFVRPEELMAEADPGLLRIALENLLGNAWKYSSGRDPACIELGVEQDGGRRVYFVRDNGAGFDMRNAQRLFTPFHRLHGREFPGTGVGLATVQRIVRQHGGCIWAQALPEAGATFFFTLAQSGWCPRDGLNDEVADVSRKCAACVGRAGSSV